MHPVAVRRQHYWLCNRVIKASWLVITGTTFIFLCKIAGFVREFSILLDFNVFIMLTTYVISPFNVHLTF